MTFLHRLYKNMASPGSPVPIRDLLASLPSKFAEGKKSGELLFFDSDAQDVKKDLRVCHC